VREYIKFTPRLKEKLANLPVNDWPAVLGEEVKGNAEGRGPEDMCQSLLDVVKPLYVEGIISREEAFALAGLEAIETPPREDT